MKQYNYEAMHQACINWCEDDNRVWPEFLEGFFLETKSRESFYEIRTPDNHWVIKIQVKLMPLDENDALIFAKFIELDMSQFEVKLMTKREAVEDYLKGLEDGVEVMHSAFYRKSLNSIEFVEDKRGGCIIDPKYFTWVDASVYFHALKLDLNPKYSDAI